MAELTVPLEMQLLFECARRQLDGSRRARIRRLAADPRIEWDTLIDAAARHRLLPLLTLHLRACEARLEEHVVQRLRKTEIAHARDGLRSVRELLLLLDQMQAAGVLAVPYKGPVLALQLYGDPALRSYGDLDLLVRRADAGVARARLAGCGYEPLHEVQDGGVDFMLRSRYSETFVHPDGKTVELHWAFTNLDIGLSLRLEDLAPRLGTLPLGGREVPVFESNDLLIILCVHGSKHRWDRLEWLCGVAEVVRQAPQTDWVLLIDRASRLGVRRMLLLGLLLASDLLEAPVPDHVLRRARADRSVRRLAAEVPQILIAPTLGHGAVSLPVDRFRLSLRERWRDRVRFTLYRMTTPSRPEEWRFISIGSWRIPVHGALRPLQLTARAFAALFRRNRRPEERDRSLR